MLKSKLFECEVVFNRVVMLTIITMSNEFDPHYVFHISGGGVLNI